MLIEKLHICDANHLVERNTLWVKVVLIADRLAHFPTIHIITVTVALATNTHAWQWTMTAKETDLRHDIVATLKNFLEVCMIGFALTVRDVL